TQEPAGSMILVVRTTGDPSLSAPHIESVIRGMDRNLPIFLTMSMEKLMGDAFAQQRLTMVLLASFAALASLMAGVGIYGVTSYLVKQRTHEIRVRMALGAKQRDVLSLVIRQSMITAAGGLAFGLAGAWGLTQLMKGLLFEVTPRDPLTFAGNSLLLLLIALLACWIPAWRASNIDGIEALRSE